MIRPHIKAIKKYQVVIAIDFGSSGSGYAYSFNNEDKIIQGSLQGANAYNKIPTEIILYYDEFEKDYLVSQFGMGCSKFMKKKKDDAIHYFKNIKMNLYKKKKTITSENSNLTLPLELVIQKFLEKIKFEAIKNIKENRPLIRDNDIKWVVTVPAIWEESAKSTMMNACIKANIVNKNTDKSLFFALEPEAASIYCSRNKEIDQNYFKKGKFYIICDLGGGTGDIVTHLVGENQNLEEIEAAQGGNYGSNEINKKIFKDIIFKIFGYDNFNDFYSDYKMKKEQLKSLEESQGILYGAWAQLEQQINSFKEDTNLENVLENDSYPINLSIFKEIYGENANIENLVAKYNNICFDQDLKLSISSSKLWIIDFPYKIINKYIENQANSISQEIKGILMTTKKQINTVIFVGGYCQNDLLISSIKKNLPKMICLKPSNPSIAVMQGAVIFGIRSDIINIRKAKYTIGVSTNEIWDEKKHKNGDKYFDKDNNVWRCRNCFSKFIEKGQNIFFGEEIKKNFIMVSPRTVNLQVYKTNKLNPSFVFEEGIEKIGEFILDAGKDYPIGERDLIETMKLGGTYLDYEAIHLKSGEKIKAILQFN